jgi:hypothetical protein
MKTKYVKTQVIVIDLLHTKLGYFIDKLIKILKSFGY